MNAPAEISSRPLHDHAEWKAGAARAFACYEYLRNDPMASRQQVDGAREKFLEMSAKLKGVAAPEPEAAHANHL